MRMMVTFDARGEATVPAAAVELPERALLAAQTVTVLDRSSRFEVRFAHDLVSPVALTGLLIWLHDQHPKPIAVFGVARDFVDILPDRRRAVAYLSELIASRSRQVRFDRRATELGETPFAAVWCAAQEICTSEMSEAARMRILEALFGGNFTLNTFEDDGDACCVSAVGSQIYRLDPKFATDGLGATYRAMSDHAYGAWLAETFESYRGRERPFAERVTAAISYPLLPPRVQFTRLVVPYCVGGAKHMLVASDAVAALN
jgi:hypothetical protein